MRCKTLGKDGKVNCSFDMEVCLLPRMDLIGKSETMNAVLQDYYLCGC